MIYNILDKIVMNDFSSTIANLVKNNDKCVVFDIGCFQGNFSRNLINKIPTSKKKFYLFDPNPNLKLKDFKHFNIAFSNKKKKQKFYLNTFFPSSGSSLKQIVKNDKFWNITRKFLSFNVGKDFKQFQLQTDTLDNFCKIKKIKKIDILKIDVEGAEYDVLIGGKKILNNTKIIQLEILGTKENFNNRYKKIVSYLKNKNFKIISEKNIWSVGILSNIKSKDLLFIKKEK